MDFDEKILGKNLVAHNDQGDSIKEESIVLIRKGLNQ